MNIVIDYLFQFIARASGSYLKLEKIYMENQNKI